MTVYIMIQGTLSWYDVTYYTIVIMLIPIIVRYIILCYLSSCSGMDDFFNKHIRIIKVKAAHFTYNS